ncbi:class I SAM-dependent methyltransferase [Nocardioides taihuensis]|uniref:Class I SAM-dependent methyltransferase n=1 Tax=Nocardioides taihuensis TaxID=1835606 RepID=A0ABW0BEK3_9ACTN
MTSQEKDQLRSRLYAAYATTHAGRSDTAASVHVFRKDLLPRLPQERDVAVVDIGCGQGDLVAWLLAEGYHRAGGIDVSPEQVAIAHERGRDTVRLGDFREVLEPASLDVVVATDFLEHFDKFEVLQILDHCRETLRPDGRVVFRVPNAVSPFGGNYRHGDATHECSFTARSLRQLLAAAGFDEVEVHPCEPAVHGATSAARWVIWKVAAGLMKLVLAAETGVPRGHLVTQNVVVTARAGGDAPR